MLSKFQPRHSREGGAQVEKSPQLPFSSGPIIMEGERKREEVPGGGESAEVSSDSREENLVVLSCREKSQQWSGEARSEGPGTLNFLCWGKKVPGLMGLLRGWVVEMRGTLVR